jgi:23S rRNA-/tRNA-specific pseudouridylate synthase
LLELVHRLDRETSGILLVAKKRSALKNLQDQFRERETGKTYLALVAGQWPARRKVLDKSLHKYLLPDGERRVKVVAKDHPDAMPSLTLVKVVRQSPDLQPCWRSRSRPVAPTRSGCTWRPKACPSWGMTSTVISNC